MAADKHGGGGIGQQEYQQRIYRNMDTASEEMRDGNRRDMERRRWCFEEIMMA